MFKHNPSVFKSLTLRVFAMMRQRCRYFCHNEFGSELQRNRKELSDDVRQDMYKETTFLERNTVLRNCLMFLCNVHLAYNYVFLNYLLKLTGFLFLKICTVFSGRNKF